MSKPVQPGGPAAPIDCSGRLPDGRAFADLAAFAETVRDAESDSRHAFGPVLVRRLASYALGRPLGLADEELLDGLVAQARRDGWKLRTLIRHILVSRAFTHG